MTEEGYTKSKYEYSTDNKTIIGLNELLIENDFPKHKNSKLIVRLTTSCWHDCKGIHQKRSINVLRRKSKDAFDILEEDASSVGADMTIDRIINFNECKDGIYQVITCNEHRDWETGYIDDYDFKLIKYENRD